MMLKCCFLLGIARFCGILWKDYDFFILVWDFKKWSDGFLETGD